MIFDASLSSSAGARVDLARHPRLFGRLLKAPQSPADCLDYSQGPYNVSAPAPPTVAFEGTVCVTEKADRVGKMVYVLARLSRERIANHDSFSLVGAGGSHGWPP